MTTLKLSLVGLGSRLVILTVGTVNTILLARYLEPRGRGEFFLFHTVVGILTTFGDCGLSQSANVFSAQHDAWRDRIHGLLLNLVVALWLATGVVAGAVYWIAGTTLVPNFSPEWAVLAAAALPMTMYGNFWNGLMIGAGGIWQYNLMRVGVLILSVLLNVVFIVVLGHGVRAAILINLCALLAQSVAMLLTARSVCPAPGPTPPPPSLARQMLSFGLRGYGNAVSGQLWLRAPVLILNIYHGPLAVGIFSVAQALCDMFLMPVQAVQDSIYRKVSVQPRDAATLSTNRYLRLAASGMALLAGLGEGLAFWVIVVAFGRPYSGAVGPFRVLLIGTATMALPMLLAPYFLAQLRRPGLLSILAATNVVVSALLCWLLIPAASAVGAAIALALTEILGTGIVLTLYLRMARTEFAQTLFLRRPDVAAALEQFGGLLRRKGA